MLQLNLSNHCIYVSSLQVIYKRKRGIYDEKQILDKIGKRSAGNLHA